MERNVGPDQHYVFWCKIKTSIPAPFRFDVNGVSIRLPDSFFCNGASIGRPDSFFCNGTSIGRPDSFFCNGAAIRPPDSFFAMRPRFQSHCKKNQALSLRGGCLII